MKEKPEAYRPTDKLRGLIADNAQLLMALSRFGIPLGFGDKTVVKATSTIVPTTGRRNSFATACVRNTTSA